MVLVLYKERTLGPISEAYFSLILVYKVHPHAFEKPLNELYSMFHYSGDHNCFNAMFTFVEASLQTCIDKVVQTFHVWLGYDQVSRMW